MTCEHLRQLEQEILDRGHKPTFRGQAWSSNCREWVYFDLVFDVESLRKRLAFAPCVKMTENRDPKSGTEMGLYCEQCKDAIMGLHPEWTKVDADKMYH